MRTAITLSVAMGVLVLASATSAGAVSLEQAAASGRATVDVTAARSYSSVQITVRNTGDSSLRVTAMPGVLFANENLDEQDVTLAEPLALEIPAGKSVTRTVATYCVRPDLQAPTHGAHYRTAGFDRDISLFLHAHYAHRANPGVQNRLWHLIEQRGVRPGRDAPATAER